MDLKELRANAAPPQTCEPCADSPFEDVLPDDEDEFSEDEDDEDVLMWAEAMHLLEQAVRALKGHHLAIEIREFLDYAKETEV